MGVEKKKKKPEKETLQDKLNKTLDELKTWADYGLPYNDFALKKIESWVKQLSEIHKSEEGGKLFDKKTSKSSADACIRISNKINEQIENDRKDGKDVSKLNDTAALINSYLLEAVEPPEFKFKPPPYQFYIKDTGEALIFSGDHHISPKKVEHADITVPKSLLDFWINSAAKTFYNQGFEKPDILPEVEKIMDYFGVKNEFRMAVSPILGPGLNKSMKLLLAQNVADYVLLQAEKKARKQLEKTWNFPAVRPKKLKKK